MSAHRCATGAYALHGPHRKIESLRDEIAWWGAHWAGDFRFVGGDVIDRPLQDGRVALEVWVCGQCSTWGFDNGGWVDASAAVVGNEVEIRCAFCRYEWDDRPARDPHVVHWVSGQG